MSKEKVLQKLWEAIGEEVKYLWSVEDAQREGVDDYLELEKLRLWDESVKASLKAKRDVRTEVERQLTLNKFS